jgi:hypothetical protein
MAQGHHRCESCGSQLGASRNGSAMRASGIPYDARREEGDRRLREYAEAMESVAGQLAALRVAVQAGAADSEQVLEILDGLGQQLRQRHGLCIQRDCIVCRAQEQAIKDHVVLYIDWKVPGTMEKLEQARRGT